jgi:voltage-gated potassium channel
MELLSGSDCEVEEFQLSSDPADLEGIDGASLAELELGRRSGAMVLAVRHPVDGIPNPWRESEAGRLFANPGGHVRLGAGQLLVVLGSKEQLRRFADLLGRAVVDVGSMTS